MLSSVEERGFSDKTDSQSALLGAYLNAARCDVNRSVLRFLPAPLRGGVGVGCS